MRGGDGRSRIGVGWGGGRGEQDGGRVGFSADRGACCFLQWASGRRRRREQEQEQEQEQQQQRQQQRRRQRRAAERRGGDWQQCAGRGQQRTRYMGLCCAPPSRGAAGQVRARARARPGGKENAGRRVRFGPVLTCTQRAADRNACPLERSSAGGVASLPPPQSPRAPEPQSPRAPDALCPPEPTT
ncbi:hypothetical protein BDZ91DRAFT_761732 [Kalaharituber pfeilii]|nr:hypothetical protein BDZ91DRAFT_761732 [Kalaharituber pfeilii]